MLARSMQAVAEGHIVKSAKQPCTTFGFPEKVYSSVGQKWCRQWWFTQDTKRIKKTHNPSNNLKTSEWLGIIVANTPPLETTLVNWIETDLEVQTDVWLQSRGPHHVTITKTQLKAVNLYVWTGQRKTVAVEGKTVRIKKPYIGVLMCGMVRVSPADLSQTWLPYNCLHC